MGQGIFVITEQREGAFRKVSYEALSEGRRLADVKKCGLTAIIAGPGAEKMAPTLEKYGPDKVLVADDPLLTEYTTDAYTDVVAGAVKAQNPELVIIGASILGKDLSARLAARLDAGLAMDCVAIRVENSEFIFTRPMYGGKILSDVKIDGTPKMVAIRPNVFTISETPRSVVLEKITVSAGQARTNVVERKLESADKIELTEADIIVSGGRGTGGNFTHIEELSKILGAAVGASRTAVDEGWRRHSDQVGQTGKVVSPTLYIACGISGAIQHLAGMSTSKFIVAINKDPEAPIFQKADYGVVGDLFQVLPAIIDEVKKLK
ncbi:MAG: electron transfer flavoprotein subunit alpha [Deltaproteobacteria bacterium RBG_13_49_15]|nr:MAG: electron transfer flavoprotein subunit alpha [Deltaproteobacteria bacterium RBG_13_49_15]